MPIQSKLEKLRGGGPTTSRQLRDTKLALGEYVCRIDSVTHEQGNKNGAFVFVKMTVLAVIDGPQNEEIIPKKWLIGGTSDVGQEVTAKFWESSDSFDRDIVTFCCNITGIEDTEVEPEYLLRMVGEEQPLAGWIVRVSCEHIFRKAEWVDPETKAELKEGAVGYTKIYFWESFDNEDKVRAMIGDEVYDKYVTDDEEEADGE